MRFIADDEIKGREALSLGLDNHLDGMIGGEHYGEGGGWGGPLELSDKGLGIGRGRIGQVIKVQTTLIGTLAPWLRYFLSTG